MCSIVDGALDGPLSQTKSPIESFTECKKCHNAKPVVVLRIKDAYCKQCFLEASIHKFRSTIGKHKIMRPDDQVLVAFNGNISSISLLHLLSQGSTEDKKTQKRLVFHTNVVVIDETSLFLQSDEERNQWRSNIKSLISEYSFSAYFTSLEYGLIPHDHFVIDFVSKDDEKPVDPNLTSQLKKTFDEIKEGSAKEAFLHQLKRRILVNVAKVLKFKKVFTAESSTSLASTLMTGKTIF